MSATLKPCAHCGGEANIHSLRLVGFPTLYSIYCTAHCVSTEQKTSEADAIAAWNRRADGWQPIESAPKDVRVQVCLPIDPYDDIPWAVQVAKKSRWDGSWRTTLSGGKLPFDPTHWKALDFPAEAS